MRHMAKKMSYNLQQEVLAQARENRDAEWEQQLEILEEELESGAIETSEYYEWLDENPKPSSVAAEKATARRKYKRKSKKNISNKIEIVDREALSAVTHKEVKVEWAADFNPGSLMETKNGDIGIVVAESDARLGRNKRNRPSWIKRGMEDSYVRLLVNGVEEWHKKFSVTPLND
jgi:hypothetical protein|tara:strand:- start:281 stop:805 length:525 start_codon:yes stop_codon:yes gene_type:complete